MRKGHGQSNFIEEAMPIAMNTCYIEECIPDKIQAILNNPHTESHQKHNSAFWEYAAALKTFVAAFGRMPVFGVIPDMHAKPNIYIPLQNIYRDKA